MPTLLAADDPRTSLRPVRAGTVTLDGVNYTIWNRAYYVENIGADVTDACGSAASATNGTTAQFVYIKTSVYWPGMTGSGGASGATGPLAPQPAVLDAYFAPEGGDLQTSTGTLRVFVQNMAGKAIVGKTVELRRKVGASTVSVGTKTTGTTGCVLFTGLQRGDYEAQLPHLHRVRPLHDHQPGQGAGQGHDPRLDLAHDQDRPAGDRGAVRSRPTEPAHGTP